MTIHHHMTATVPAVRRPNDRIRGAAIGGDGTVVTTVAYRWLCRPMGMPARSEGIDMTVTATSSRRRRGARIAAAFGAAVVVAGLLSGPGAGGTAAASAVVHAVGDSTTASGEPVAVAA